jgi:hypothetical protein
VILLLWDGLIEEKVHAGKQERSLRS